MTPPGRPQGEFRSAQHEGAPVSEPGPTSPAAPARPRRTSTLHARFRHAVLAVSAPLALVASVIVFELARDRYLQAERASVQAMVSAGGNSLSIGAYARDTVLLKELADGLGRYPAVLRVDVRAAIDGQSLAGAGRAEATLADTRPADLDAPLSSPFDAHEQIGQLRVWLDNERLAREAGRQAGLLVGALLALLASVLAVFSALAERLLSQPMRQLAESLAAMQPGTTGRVQVHRRHEGDEVGTVARAANQLLDLQEQALARERDMRLAIEAMEARYRGIFDSSSAGIFVLSLDGRLQQANPALSRLAGRDLAAGDRLDLPLSDPDQLDLLLQRARASMQTESDDLALVHPDGRATWVQCSLTVVQGEAPGRHHVEGVLHDVTGRHERERAARHQADHDPLTGLKNRACIERMLDEHVRSDPDRDSVLTLMFIDLDGFKAVNDRWGHAAGDAVLIEAARRLQDLFRRGTDVVGRLGGDELVVLIRGAEAGEPGIGEQATRMIESLGQPIPLPGGDLATIGASVGLASYPVHATSASTLIEAADAAMYAVKRAGKGGWVIADTRLRHDGTTLAPQQQAVPHHEVGGDALTGLLDRRAFERRLLAMQETVRSRGHPAALLCVDLDGFTSINLAHGPQIGDEVLRETARRLRRVLRRTDMLARTGSDEFALVAPTNAEERSEALAAGAALADKIVQMLGGPFSTSGRPVDVQACIGISLLSPQAASPMPALQEAQLALRLARQRQRGSVQCFEPQMMEGFLQQQALEHDLRQAAAAHQLRLHLQGQVNPQGRFVAAEALLRWHHPQRGLVPPSEFIPLAESTGLIVEVGRWVLREGCALLARLHRLAPDHALALNISPAQFNHPGFVADLLDALEQSGAPAHRLVLEITEGLLLPDIGQVGQRLRMLAERGIRFSIDDFGTGFSSLAYLRQLPLHEIKIDRSFIAGLPEDQASVGIVRSVLSMGRHLGLRVVAEGVETARQAAFLAEHGCEAQQGWHHARDCAAEDYLALLAAQGADAWAAPAAEGSEAASSIEATH